MKTTIKRALLGGLAAAAVCTAAPEQAQAQEILLTGPLAGAPAVRKLRLYREGRIEVAPAISFTLLDEYQRNILVGARINYNFTDWLAVGVWGGFGAIKLNTDLTDETQAANAQRRKPVAQGGEAATSTNRRLTAINLGQDFEEQLGSTDWAVAPQLTLVPFRGKLALFQNIYIDTDLYFFAGPAFVGVGERKACGPGTSVADCTLPASFEKESRVAIAPTFGLGFAWYVNKWNAVGFEWRAMPYAQNPGGFDNRGGDPDGEFPDLKVDDQDREFKFVQMLTLSYNFYFPRDYRVSE